MGRAQDLVIAIQGCQQPSILDQLLQLAAQLWLVLHAARQGVQVVDQAAPECIHIPFVATADKGQVALALLQQLEQPVFDGDLRVGTALAQRSRCTQRLGAIRVETAKQARGMLGHTVTSLFGDGGVSSITPAAGLKLDVFG